MSTGVARAALPPLDRIAVPEPRPDETYRMSVLGRELAFVGLKRLLGAADHDKAGDRNAGLAAASEVEREAARAARRAHPRAPLRTPAGQ